MFSLFVFVFVINYVSSASVSKLPPNLKTCKQSSPDVEKCLTDAIEDAIKLFRNGNAPLKMHSIDPLIITRVHIDQGHGPVAINLTFNDFKIEGFSDTKILKPKVDLANSRMSADALIPKLRASGTYSIDGKVLVLPIQGEGDCLINFDDIKAEVLLHTKDVTKNGEKYINVDQFTFDFAPKKLTLKFDNLFKGDKALGDNMNRFLNENWPDILAELKGAIQQAVGLAFGDIANRLFSKVPTNEIFPN